MNLREEPFTRKGVHLATLNEELPLLAHASEVRRRMGLPKPSTLNGDLVQGYVDADPPAYMPYGQEAGSGRNSCFLFLAYKPVAESTSNI